MMDRSANCRALTVLCAAAGPQRLDQLKRAAVAAEWELVGGARSVEELVEQLGTWHPNVVVIDAALGPEAVRRARELRPEARIVAWGEVAGVDDVAPTLNEIRAATLGIPRMGGPVPS